VVVPHGQLQVRNALISFYSCPFVYADLHAFPVIAGSSCIGMISEGTVDQSNQIFLDNDKVDMGALRLPCVATFLGGIMVVPPFFSPTFPPPYDANAGYVLTCVAYPQSDVTIEVDIEAEYYDGVGGGAI